jgi:hypothetical protein
MIGPRSSAQFYIAKRSLYKLLSSLHFRFFREATLDV